MKLHQEPLLNTHTKRAISTWHWFLPYFMELEWVYVSMKMALQNVPLERITYSSQCWDWPKGVIVIWNQYTKGAQTRPQLFKRWISVRETNCVIHWIEIYPVDSAIQLLNNWGQYNWTGMVKFVYMRPASWKYKWSHKACKNSAH